MEAFVQARDVMTGTALGAPPPVNGTPTDRCLGRWSARTIAVLAVFYAVAVVLGFVALGDVVRPLPDPYLAVAELLILVMAPAMVVLTAAIHACAPAERRVLSLLAFGWMLLAAGLTMTVHGLELTLGRPAPGPPTAGAPPLFGFDWPAVLYGVDIVAWDLMLGLSLLFAAAVFPGREHRLVRRGLALSGVLCLAGLVGPAIDVMAWRALGIAGYAVVFPLTCLALSRTFAEPGPGRPPRDRAPRG
jgi:hypothetical protein